MPQNEAPLSIPSIAHAKADCHPFEVLHWHVNVGYARRALPPWVGVGCHRRAATDSPRAAIGVGLPRTTRRHSESQFDRIIADDLVM